MIAAIPAPPETEQQVPQWLFAFDAATWAGFRALGLLAAQPGAVDRARDELRGLPDLPFLRATVLESVRLWPTTPAILRDTTQDTEWEGGTLPAGASVLIFASYFHRDETRLPEAHRFAPELWLRERTDQDWPLVPFSGGPGICPGRNLVLLTTSLLLAGLVGRTRYQVEGAGLGHRERFDALSVAEPTLARSPEQRIIVELPGLPGSAKAAEVSTGPHNSPHWPCLSASWPGRRRR